MPVVLGADLAAAKAELGLGEHHDAPAFRRLVGERRELRAIGEQLAPTPRRPAGTPTPGGCRA